jgi:enoyl-CoA hydratase/carnithine racemase
LRDVPAHPEIGPFADVGVTLAEDFVANVEIRRPPNNHFDAALIASLADAFEALDEDPRCRTVVLCAEGKHFCAGANLGGPGPGGGRAAGSAGDLYDEAVRLFQTRTPVVAAVQGAAVGGGLGLALLADFRVAAPEARFSANFARLGFHHGFGLSVTLPALVGQQRALEMLYTGVRLKGEEALAIGLCDRLAPLAARSARPCAATWPSACAPRPGASRPSRSDCARPTTSPRAFAPRRSGARRASPGADPCSISIPATSSS